VVVVEQTTPDIDFYLYQIPNVGYVEGFVSLVNGAGDVTEATVTAGSQSANPMENGYYFLALPAGVYTVTASHPYTLSDSIADVTVIMGETTGDIDFELEIIRGNLSAKAVDQWGFSLYDVGVQVIGPEEILTGTITGDSLVFENVLYGQYSGTAWLVIPDTAYAMDELNSTDHDIVFVFYEMGIHEDKNTEDNTLLISPNPSSGNTVISFKLEIPGIVSVKIYAHTGQLIRTLADGIFDAGQHHLNWNGTDESGQAIAAGAYTVVMKTSKERSAKVLIRN